MAYRFAMLRNKEDTRGKTREVPTMEDFAEAVKRARSARKDDDKLGAPAFCAPLDGKGRKKENVQPRNWAAIDIDGPKSKADKESKGISPHAAEAAIRELAQYAGFVYPTDSDRPEARKLRAVIAFDKELDKEQWARVTRSFCEELADKLPELAGAIDSASWAPGQIMFTCPKKNAQKLRVLRGTPLSTAKYLAYPPRHCKTTRANRAQNAATPAPLAPSEVLKRHGLADPLDVIKERGLYIREISPGKHAISCPSGDHEQGSESSTAYLEPGAVDTGKIYRYPAIRCLHDHCRERQTGDFFKVLGLDYEQYRRAIDEGGNTPDKFKTDYGEFTVSDNVVYLTLYTKAGSITRAVFPELEIKGRARENGSLAWGRIVSFRSPENEHQDILVDDTDLTGKGDTVREALTSRGFPLYHTGPQINRYICDFLYRRPLGDGAPLYRIVRAPGWQGANFVAAPGLIFGNGEEPIYCCIPKEEAANWENCGDLEAWKQSIGHLARVSSPLALGLCIAFSGPLISLMPWTEKTSGGFHFYANSTVGKTSILRAAAGVYGRPDSRIVQWSGTINALEGEAIKYNGSLLCLDELKTSNAKGLEGAIYRLYNGKEKARLTKESSQKPARTWQVPWLSTGEASIERYVQQSGKAIEAGADIRCASINVDMGAKTGNALGVFEVCPPGVDIKGAFGLLSRGAAENYGVAGAAWLHWLAGHKDEAPGLAAPIIDDFKNNLPGGLGSQQERALNRFILCAVAGELATRAGITGWAPGDAVQAVRTMFIRYLGEHAGERKEVRQLIKDFQEAAQNLSKFGLLGTNDSAEWGLRDFSPGAFETTDDIADTGGTGEDETEKTEQKPRRLYLFDSTFRKCCGNYEEKEAALILLSLGILLPGEKAKNQKPRLKKKTRYGRYYAVDLDRLNSWEPE